MISEFGLIGKKLSHSFSKKYFEEKFRDLGLIDHSYHLFEMNSATDLEALISNHPSLRGLNVTIPYKQDVFELLDEVEDNAQRIGAVNAISIRPGGHLKGYNTDYFGFRESLTNWLHPVKPNDLSALVLGSGGASKAVCCVLDDMRISYTLVSRKNHTKYLTYEDLNKDEGIISGHRLIINTTPLGMFPEIETYPSINYNLITENHFAYDLVYNPEKTLFMTKCDERGGITKNGLEMLHLQAEKSWELWTK